MDLFRIAEGNLSICGVMIGDNFDEQRDKLIKDGLTSENWELSKGTILIDPQEGCYTNYLKNATIKIDGVTINSILFQAEFSSFPNDVVDSFLGIVLELEEHGIPVIKPEWHVFDNRITNQYKVHNALWDIETNVIIAGRGDTNITLKMTANLTDADGAIAEDAIGVYICVNKFARREWQLIDYHNKPNTIFL